MNALKHGLSARTPEALREVSGQAAREFLDIYQQMHDHYLPRDAMEVQLVKRIARCLWRLRLSELMERRLVERRTAANTPGTSYERILKYERLVDIHLHRAIAALERKRESHNISNQQNELPPRSG